MSKGKANKGGTTVQKCTCESAYQDEKYGAGMRVHNVTDDGTRCTVCATKKQGSAPAKSE